jgi:hypothetical protein
MKPNRYARRNSPRVTLANSPRVTPAKLESGGISGRAHAGQPADPTAGITGQTATVRRPKRNTMRNARHGGAGIRYYEPAELARESLAYTDVHAPARVANRRYEPGTYQDTLAAASAEGFRQRDMAKHSQLRTTGAVRIDRDGPVWAND